MKTYTEWAEAQPRTVGEFLLTFKNQDVQCHVLKALKSHEHYAHQSYQEIIQSPITAEMEHDVQEHLGLI